MRLFFKFFRQYFETKKTLFKQLALRRAPLLALAGIIIIAVFWPFQSAQATSWLAGYSYRKQINLTGQSGAGANYQVKLLIGKTSGATGENFDLGGHCLDSMLDMRFTADDGDTQLNYWIESVAASGDSYLATVWVEVSADLNSNQNIYIYYGKADDTGGSNGGNTFIFFDDFSNGLSQWNRSATDGTSSIESGELSLSVTGANAYKYEGYTTNATFSTPFIFEWRENFITYTSPSGTPQSCIDYPADSGKTYVNYYGANWNFFYHNATQYGKTVSAGWHTNKLSVNSNNITFLFDDSQISNVAGTGSATGTISIKAGQYKSGISTHLHFDDIRLRKYAATEPAYSSAGSEEEPASNNVPDTPSSLGAAGYVNGSWSNDNTPVLEFTQSDTDAGDTVKYQIQIDDNADFGSTVVDYTSALAAQGATSFTVGQAAGSGTYTAGSAGQTLADGSYYWRVMSTDNSNATSTWATANSGAIAFKIDTAAPANVGINSITADSAGQLTIAGLTATDSGSGLHSTPYWFNETTGNSGGSSSTDWQASTTFVDNSLTANTQYTYKIKAKDAAGNESEYSAELSAYTLAGQVNDIAIANATDASNYKLSLSWSDNGQSGIKIEQDTNCDGYETTVYDNASSSPASPYIINAAAATCYKFRISSYNGDGVLNSSSIPETNQITAPAAQPQNLASSAHGETSITWDWDDVAAATGYKVYDLSNTLLATIDGAISTWEQTGLNANTQYTIYVRATNTNGEGIASSNAADYTSASAPVNAGHSGNSGGSITWTWQSGGAQKDFNATSTDTGESSGWTLNTFWQQIVAAINQVYHFIVGARNEENEETATAGAQAYSQQEAPSEISFSNITSDSITATAGGSFANLTLGSSGLYFENITATSTPGWIQTQTWTNSSLSPDTIYTYRAKARNGDGDETSWSGEFSKCTLAQIPAAPTISAIATSTLNLSINQGDNGSTTQYAIFEDSATNKYLDSTTGALSADAADWKTYEQWNGGGIAVNGLSQNTTYRFKAKTKNQEGVETEFGATAAALTSSVPNPPTSPGPADYINGAWSNNAAPLLNFDQSDPDAGDTVKYRIQIDDSADFDSAIVDYTSALAAQGVASFAVGQAAGSGTYAAGSAGQTLADGSYYWRVMSTDNSNYESSWMVANSGAIAFKIDTAAPTNIGINSITADSATQLTINGSTATDSGSGPHATPYWFSETTGNTGGSSSADWQASTTFIDNGLAANTQYTYKVKAKDAAGNESAYSSETSKYTLANPPSSVAATVNSQTAITISWNENSNPAGTEYYLENQTASTNSGWITATSTQSTGLTCGTNYAFRVKSRNRDNTETEWATATAATNACDQPAAINSTSPGGQYAVKPSTPASPAPTIETNPATSFIPTFAPIGDIFKNIAKPIKNIGQKIAEAINWKPKEEKNDNNEFAKPRPEPPAPALTGIWNLLPPTVNLFALAPIPFEMQKIKDSFPEIGALFGQIGINKMADMQKLQNAELFLPGLAEIMKMGDPLAAGGQIAPIENLPLAEIPAVLKQKIPENFVFAAGGGNLDLGSKLKLNHTGDIEQTVRAIVKRPVRLAVKIDKPAETVRGYLVSQGGVGFEKNPILAAIDSMLASVAAAIGKDTEPKNLLLEEFEYADPDGDGIYEADIYAPAMKGNYQIITSIKYRDNEEELRQLKLVLVVDPEGYVFEKSGNREIRIPDANVSIEWKNPQTGEFELWPAKNFRQTNPQITDQTGQYAFLTPPGEYRLIIIADDYEYYQGESFNVAEGAGVHENIQLKPNRWNWKNFDWKFWLLALILAIIAFAQIIRILIAIKNKKDEK